MKTPVINHLALGRHLTSGHQAQGVAAVLGTVHMVSEPDVGWSLGEDFSNLPYFQRKETSKVCSDLCRALPVQRAHLLPAHRIGHLALSHCDPLVPSQT